MKDYRLSFDKALAQFKNLIHMIPLDHQDQWFMVAGTLISAVRYHNIVG